MNKQADVHSSRLLYSHPSLEPRPCFHRLHEPRSSCIHTSGYSCLRCCNIAILFDVIVLYWRNLIVEFLHLLWDYIYCCYMMVLNFLKSTRPSLPLKKAPPLISVFSPQARRGKPPSGAQNRYAIRLSDHQRSSPYCAGWDRMEMNNNHQHRNETCAVTLKLHFYK